MGEKFIEYVEAPLLKAEGYQYLHLDGIVSLDISSPWKVSNVDCCCVFEKLSFMLPNLRELDMSNIGGELFGEDVLRSFSRNCPKLERITWNNIDSDCLVWLDGYDIIDSTNLTEIIMDGSTFYCNALDVDNDVDELSDFENNSDVFLFCRCKSQVLERVSIRGAICNDGYGPEDDEIVPQNALIKYIRHAPRSLRWFRSDLSQENIEMLRLERPEI